MKKYFILVAAALVALAACSKMEVSETTPQKEITFEIAKYSAQTKAGENTALNAELVNGNSITSFYTNAWYYTDGEATSQRYMTNQEVRYIAGNSTTSAKWAPYGRTYFWPKTGWINFFSYAGAPAPTAVAENTLTYGTTSNPLTIGTGANVLIADAAYKYNDNNPTPDDPYYHMSTTNEGTVGEGVPTLFRHALAKLTVDVKFDATGIENKYTFDVDVLSASVKVNNKGSLAVAFTPQNTKGTVKWSTPASTDKIGWVPSSAAYVAIDAPSTAIEKSFTANPATSDITAQGGKVVGSAENTPLVLINENTVMPQEMVNPDDDTKQATLSISYKLKTTYTDGENSDSITETVTLTDIPMVNFKYNGTNNTPTAIEQWNMNTKYTYHITIKPGGVVLFDPAVEPWVVETNEPVYTYPED